MSSKQGRVFDLFILAISLGAFAFFSLRQLDLPGLYYDEAADAVPAMQLVLGQKVELLNQTGLLLGDKSLPIMTMDYVGTVNTYLLVPLFKLLGVNVVSLRLLTILGSALTIILSYFVVKELLDRATAAAAVLLLSVHPSFVFWSRQGIHVTSIMTVMSTGSLLCFLLWHKKRQPILLYLAIFLLGLGLSAKLLFLWFILALVASALLFLVLPRLLSRLWPDGATKRSLSPLHLLVCLVTFLLGAWMIILYNVLTRATLTVLAKNSATTTYGVNNLDFFSNLRTSLGAFETFLRGDNFWYLGGLFTNDWYPPAFVVASLGTLALLLHPQVRRRWRSLLFPLALVVLLVIQSCFTVSGLWSTHFFIAYPFPQLVIAAFVVTAARLLPWRKLAVGIALLALAVLIGRDVYVNSEYHRVLAKTGGLYTHSDAVYRLAEYMDGRGVKEPIALDWGIKTSVQILTQGRINPIEIFQYEQEPNSVFFDWLYGSLTTRPNTLYIFHAEDNEVFPRYQAFLALAQKLDKKVTLEQTIRRKDGAPLFTVYSAK